MKTKIIIFSVAIASLLSASFVNSKTSEASLILIKTVEKPNGTGLQSSALGIYKDGVIVQQIELNDLNGKKVGDNLKILGDVILKYKSEGYELISAAGGGGTNTIAITYIMEKK